MRLLHLGFMNLSGGIIKYKYYFLVFFLTGIFYTNSLFASPSLYIRNRLVSIPIYEKNGRFYAPLSQLIFALNKKLSCNKNANTKNVSSELVIVDEGIQKNGECWVPLDKVAKAVGAIFIVNNETQILDIAFPLKLPVGSALNSKSPGSSAQVEITQESPEEIYKQVQDFLAGEIDFPVSPLPFLTMATKDELLVQHNAAGIRVRTDLAGFYRPFNPEKIFILDELPKDEIGGVMAHELAHAWASRNLPSLSDILEEGFAQWVEFKWFEAKGNKRMINRLLKNTDPVYGNGLRILHQAEQSGGRDKVLGILKSGNIPDKL